jgi:hypothetical protein
MDCETFQEMSLEEQRELSDGPTLILMFIMLVILAIGGLLSRDD